MQIAIDVRISELKQPERVPNLVLILKPQNTEILFLDQWSCICLFLLQDDLKTLK